MQFDRETQQAYKSQAYVKFGEMLYVDRFLDSADAIKKAESKTVQAALTTSREWIQRLTQDKVRRLLSVFPSASKHVVARTICSRVGRNGRLPL